MRTGRKLFVLLALSSALHLGCFLGLQAGQSHVPEYDLVIKNGLVLDGSLTPAVRRDIAIRGDQVVRVAPRIDGPSGRVIDARGCYVTPGFIDLHTHVDEGMFYRENRACLNYLTQGVTSVVVGQCGGSAWPIFETASELIRIWSEEGIGPNAALLVGHGTVRQIVMGLEDREPTPEELGRMKALVREAMEQGASGLSTGLIYVPGTYAKTAEVVELVKEVAPYGGIYHTHIRNERERLLDAVREAIEISEKTGVPAHISHFKALGKANWGLVREASGLIEEARARGLRITADQYPFRFSNGYPYRPLIPRSVWTGRAGPESLESKDIEAVFDYLRDDELIDLYKKITPAIPLSANHERFLKNLPRKGLVRLVAGTLVDLDAFRGPANARERSLFIDRLRNPAEAEAIRKAVRQSIDESVGAENIFVGLCAEKELEGKTLAEVAAIKRTSVEEAAIELELMGALCIPYAISDDDIAYVMKKDYVSTGSDGTAPFYGIGLTHTRSYATFLHKIKTYCLERGGLTLPQVIRSQTSLPAEIMNWPDRGRIKEGFKADLVVLDLNATRTPSSISNPHQYSKGVSWLVINGKLVLDKGRWTGTLPGKILKPKNA